MPGEQETIRIIDLERDKADIAQLISALQPLKEEIKSFSTLSVASKKVSGVGDFKAQASQLSKGIEDIAQAQTKLHEATTQSSTKLKNLTENSELLRKALGSTKAQLEDMTRAGTANSQAGQKLASQVETLTTLVNQQAKGFSSLTMEIRSGERALQTMREAGLQNTSGFKEIQVTVANARREFNEFAKTQKILSSEAPAITALSTAARGLGGAYAIGAGGAALLADGDEKVEKELNKLVAIMTVLKGLEEVDILIKQRGAIVTALYSTAERIWNLTIMETVAATYALRISLGLLTGGLFLLVPLLLDLKEKNDKAAAAQKDFNDILDASKESFTKAVQNVATLKENIELAKEGILDKTKVVKEYNDTIGKTTGEVKNLDEAEQALTKNADAYIKMTLYKAVAEEAFKKAAEKTFDIEKQRLEKIDEAGISKAAASVGLTEEGYGTIKKVKAEKEAAIKEKQEEADGILKIGEDYQKKAAELAAKFHFDFFGGEEDDKKKDKEAKEKKLKDLQDYAERFKQILNSITEYGQKAFGIDVTPLQRELNAAFVEYDRFFVQIRDLREKDLKEVSDEVAKGEITQANAVKQRIVIQTKSQQDLTALELAYQNNVNAIKEKYRKEEEEKARQHDEKMFADHKKFESEVTKELQETAKRQQKDIDDKKKAQLDLINKIAQYVQEGENLISGLENAAITRKKNALQDQEDAQQRNYEAEVKRINSLTGNDEQRAAQLKILESQRQVQKEANERKNRQIEQEHARFEKAAAITKIVLTTAEAVSKAFVDGVTPVDKAIGAAVAAAIGAAQLAVAVAQPVPHYFRGTGHSAEGWALTDEKGAEGYIPPSGKPFLGNDRPTLRFLEKGTKIIPHDEVNKMLLQQIFKGTVSSIEKDNGKDIRELKEAILMGSQAQVNAIKKQRAPAIHFHNDAGFLAHINASVRD